ncbi:hypothetical protein LTS15_004760 [Exophiala xenobiotica]|nr:hypothetical protein LTS15_004760 [Exophiala xenobiotica]
MVVWFNSTYPPPNKQRLLPEIISHIISFVIPNGGLTISNDPNRNSDFDTIISLLKTSIKIKDETLRQIYRQPLHIYITSGQDCTCRRLLGWSPDPHIFGFPLLRATSLPLGNWPILNIHFEPDAKSRRSYLLSPGLLKLRSGELPLWEVQNVCSCVCEQSKLLGERLKNAEVESTTLKTVFTFGEVWVASTDNSQQRQALYNIWAVFYLLRPWRWTAAASPKALTDQISFPTMLFTGRYRDDVPDDHETACSRSVIEDIERQFSVWWSPRSQRMPTSLVDEDIYPPGCSFTGYAGLFADNLSNATELLCIKITPDMTEGDNGLGIWEPATLRRER